MASRRGRLGGKTEEQGTVNGGDEGGGGAEYEESRAQRIKENAERMKSLGILALSKQLKRPSSSQRKTKTPTPATSNDPPRRSSRLKDMPRVSYSEKKPQPPDKDSVEDVEIEIHIPEGKNLEIYTEEHEKLLGDSEAVWELFVDGFDEDGQRIYDPVEGKSCHQCRQKLLDSILSAASARRARGQLCGDCLFMRYGENVTEANLKPDWVCPMCRGICNCSRCRRDKGWQPTAAIYKKVKRLGYKSVAHYLIHTRRGQAKMEEGAAESLSSDDTCPLADDNNKKGRLSDALPGSGFEKFEAAKGNLKLDSDEEYRGDDYEDDGHDDNDDSH